MNEVSVCKPNTEGVPLFSRGAFSFHLGLLLKAESEVSWSWLGPGMICNV